MNQHDEKKLIQLWKRGLTWREIANELGIPQGTARWLGVKYGLRRRATRAEMLSDGPPSDDWPPHVPTAEEIAASEDSLRLSPYVQRRIKELGIHGTKVSGDPLLTLQEPSPVVPRCTHAGAAHLPRRGVVGSRGHD